MLLTKFIHIIGLGPVQTLRNFRTAEEEAVSDSSGLLDDRERENDEVAGHDS